MRPHMQGFPSARDQLRKSTSRMTYLTDWLLVSVLLIQAHYYPNKSILENLGDMEGRQELKKGMHACNLPAIAADDRQVRAVGGVDTRCFKFKNRISPSRSLFPASKTSRRHNSALPSCMMQPWS